MKPWEIILGIFFTALWFIPFLIEIIILPFLDHLKYLKKFFNWNKEHPDLQRIQCKNCKYHISKTFYEGRYPHGTPERYVVYCKLFKRKIDGIHYKNIRCRIAEPTEYFCEPINTDEPLPKSEVVYYSAYGDCFHSTPNCPTIKGSKHLYKNIFCNGRRPCPKCWIEKNGTLYPRK